MPLYGGFGESQTLKMIRETFYGFNKSNPTHLEKLKHVLSLQGKKRWRAAANLYLFLNPKSYVWDERAGQMVVAMDARNEARIIAEEAAATRKALDLSNNSGGFSRGSLEKGNERTATRQYTLRMPVTMLQFIQMIDPDLTETTKGSAGREKWRQLREEFKEFQVSTL